MCTSVNRLALATLPSDVFWFFVGVAGRVWPELERTVPQDLEFSSFRTEAPAEAPAPVKPALKARSPLRRKA